MRIEIGSIIIYYALKATAFRWILWLGLPQKFQLGLRLRRVPKEGLPISSTGPGAELFVHSNYQLDLYSIGRRVASLLSQKEE